MPKIKTEKRTESIKIRVTKTEKKELENLKTERHLASWMRNIALGQKPIKRADPELVRAIGRIGSNLNQIAKYANTKKTLDNNILLSINNIEKILIELIDEHKNGVKGNDS